MDYSVQTDGNRYLLESATESSREDGQVDMAEKPAGDSEKERLKIYAGLAERQAYARHYEINRLKSIERDVIIMTKRALPIDG